MEFSGSSELAVMVTRDDTGREGLRSMTRSVVEIKELEPHSGALGDRAQVLEALKKANVPVMQPAEVVDHLMDTMKESRMVKRYSYVEVCDALDDAFEDSPTAQGEVEEVIPAECLDYQGSEIAGETVTR